MELIRPTKVWSQSEVLATPSPVPKQPGIYAWYFREVPPTVLVSNCVCYDCLTLLYLGIAPTAPPKDGTKASGQTLSDRIHNHYRGNASGSTLRLSLGCLLSQKLNIQLRRVGKTERMTFADGEASLTVWMRQNAFVTWVVDPQPWEHEVELIATYSPPHNLQHNRSNPFYMTLSSVRSTAKATARQMPVRE